MIPDYPKSLNIPHKHLKNLWDGATYAQEKIDGSQISFGIIDGVLQGKSRRQPLQMDADCSGMFRAGIMAILEVQHLLPPGWVYRGEYLAKPKHNVLKYDHTPANHIIIFDVNMGDPLPLALDYLEEEAERLGFQSAPLLGTFFDEPTKEQFASLLATESILGGQKIEGVVFKNYSHLDDRGDILMGKYVSDKFREKHSMNKRVSKGQGSAVDKIVDKYKTDALWNKAIQHLTEEGELSGEMKDIPVLLMEINKDALIESGEVIRAELFNLLWGEISKGLRRNFAEYYRQHIEGE